MERASTGRFRSPYESRTGLNDLGCLFRGITCEVLNGPTGDGPVLRLYRMLLRNGHGSSAAFFDLLFSIR